MQEPQPRCARVVKGLSIFVGKSRYSRMGMSRSPRTFDRIDWAGSSRCARRLSTKVCWYVSALNPVLICPAKFNLPFKPYRPYGTAYDESDLIIPIKFFLETLSTRAVLWMPPARFARWARICR